MWSVIDTRLDGQLNQRLRQLRADGKSCEAIARHLAAEADQAITGETVRRWLREAAA